MCKYGRVLGSTDVMIGPAAGEISTDESRVSRAIACEFNDKRSVFKPDQTSKDRQGTCTKSECGDTLFLCNNFQVRKAQGWGACQQKRKRGIRGSKQASSSLESVGRRL